MSITLYSKYRRQRLRRAWSLAGMSQTVAYVASGVMALFLAYAFVAWHDASVEDAERIGRSSGERDRVMAEAKAERMSKALADCLNGGALKVSGTDDAIFWDRASYQKGL